MTAGVRSGSSTPEQMKTTWAPSGRPLTSASVNANGPRWLVANARSHLCALSPALMGMIPALFNTPAISSSMGREPATRPRTPRAAVRVGLGSRIITSAVASAMAGMRISTNPSEVSRIGPFARRRSQGATLLPSRRSSAATSPSSTHRRAAHGHSARPAQAARRPSGEASSQSARLVWFVGASRKTSISQLGSSLVELVNEITRRPVARSTAAR